MLTLPLLLYITTLCSALRHDATFDGDWRLDRSREAGSSDDVLQLIGVGAFQRHIIAGLDVSERFVLTPQTLRLVRDTALSHTDDTWRWAERYDVHDLVLGDCEQQVVLQQGHLVTHATRSDRAVYQSVRKLQSADLFSNMINFTTGDGRQAFCVRYYDRVRRSRAVQ